MDICSKLEKKIDSNLNLARETLHTAKNKNCLSGRKIGIKVFALELVALIARIVRLPVVIVIIQPFRVVVFTTTLLTFRLIKPLNRFDSHLPGFKDIYHTMTKIPRLFIGILSTGLLGIVISPEANFKIHCGMKLLRQEVKKPEDGKPDDGEERGSKADSEGQVGSQICSTGNLNNNMHTPKTALELAQQRNWEYTPNRAEKWKKLPLYPGVKEMLIAEYEGGGEEELDDEEYDEELEFQNAVFHQSASPAEDPAASTTQQTPTPSQLDLEKENLPVTPMPNGIPPMPTDFIGPDPEKRRFDLMTALTNQPLRPPKKVMAPDSPPDSKSVAGAKPSPKGLGIILKNPAKPSYVISHAMANSTTKPPLPVNSQKKGLFSLF